MSTKSLRLRSVREIKSSSTGLMYAKADFVAAPSTWGLTNAAAVTQLFRMQMAVSGIAVETAKWLSCEFGALLVSARRVDEMAEMCRQFGDCFSHACKVDSVRSPSDARAEIDAWAMLNSSSVIAPWLYARTLDFAQKLESSTEMRPYGAMPAFEHELARELDLVFTKIAALEARFPAVMRGRSSNGGTSQP